MNPRHRTLIALALGLALAVATTASADHCASGHGTKRSTDAGGDIVDTALAAGSFNTLATALATADLVDTLKGPGPFTVFAPTDEAFAKLPSGTVESLLEPENRHQLVEILGYHVVPGKISAAEAAATRSAHTVEGSAVSFRIVDGRLTVNDAAVVASDVAAANGVIHVIDSVLLPN